MKNTLTEINNLDPFQPILSEDGYIRLTLAQLQRLPLHHLHSTLYDDPNSLMQKETSLAEIKGFTEWVSDTQPVISVGWDWQVAYLSGSPDYAMLGQPFSNIMLQNHQLKDLGTSESLSQLATWLNTLNWQEKVYQYIQAQYS